MAQMLDSEQEALLAAVLNCLIPARGDLAGAGDLGLVAPIDAAMAANPAVRRTYFNGLPLIAAAAERPFAELDAAGQEAVLAAIEATQPLFFAVLIEHAYRHYYTDPRVQRAVGLTDGPPQPDGYHLPAFDEGLLTIQRKRAPFWRHTS
jgi:hypothetical protein